MMHSSANGISACLFGSAARSSTDLLSDRDVLVTARRLKATRPYVRELGSKGYSVQVNLSAPTKVVLTCNMG